MSQNNIIYAKQLELSQEKKTTKYLWHIPIDTLDPMSHAKVKYKHIESENL